MFPFASKKSVGRRRQKHFQKRSQLRRRMRRLLFEGLENRALLATFAEAGSLLNLDMNVANVAVGVVSAGTSYTLTLTGDTWSGSDSGNVTGNGTNTLSVSTAGLGVFDTINITDSAIGSAVNFNNSNANSYGDTFNVNLDEAAGTIMFSGASSFTGMAALTASTSRNIVFSSGASVSTFDGNLTLNANQQATPTSGNFRGINVNAAAIASASGSISLQGKGGTLNAQGIYLHDGAVVGSGTTGPVSVIGTGGASGGDDHGVLITGLNTRITSGGGNIAVTGQGGSGGGPNTR